MTEMTIYFLVDATGSMGTFLVSLQSTLRQMFLLKEILYPNLEFRLVVYRDYCDAQVLILPCDILLCVKTLRAAGGGDRPEASRTGLRYIAEQVVQQTAIVMHYTDAPPHSYKTGGNNYEREKKALHGKLFGDSWESVVEALTNTPVLTFAPLHVGSELDQWFGPPLGTLFKIDTSTAAHITRASLEQLEPHLDTSADLERLFRTDAKYRAVCLARFGGFVNRADVLILTYNKALGRIWRCICATRDDECNEVQSAMNKLLPSLLPNVRNILSTWMLESYNQIDRIKDMQAAAGEDGGCLVLPCAPGITIDELLSLGRAPTPSTLKKVQDLLMHLTEVALPRSDIAYVPLAFSDHNLFCALSHLISPGVLLSSRPAAMIALMLVANDEPLLAPRARQYLTGVRGKWLPINDIEKFPEIVGREFIRFLFRALSRDPDFFTDTEIALYAKLHPLVDAMVAYRQTHTFSIPWAGNDVVTTHVRPCTECGTEESLTLLEKGRCVGCTADIAVREHTGEKQYMVKCRSCRCMYAVARPSLLKCTPKCHWCREKKSVSRISCTSCKTRYIFPDMAGETWTCIECPAPKEVLASAAVLCDENAGCLDAPSAAFVAEVLRKNGTLYKSREMWAPDIDFSPFRTEPLTYKGDPILTPVELLGTPRLDTCTLCFEQSTVLESACGRCTNLVCAPCLKEWYCNVLPGKCVLPTHCLCPFCRRRPHGKTLRRYNKQACTIVFGNEVYDPDWFHGWCVQCFRVRPWMERACGGTVPEDKVGGFVCEDCNVMPHVPNTKQCPGCTATIEKNGGCGHMTCRCNTHFCWYCLFVGEEDDVYDHIGDEHQ